MNTIDFILDGKFHLPWPNTHLFERCVLKSHSSNLQAMQWTHMPWTMSSPMRYLRNVDAADSDPVDAELQELHQRQAQLLRERRRLQTQEVREFKLKNELNTMFDVEKAIEHLAMRKATTNSARLFFLGVVAGWWVGVACLMTQTV
jgi:hypothetical protein